MPIADDAGIIEKCWRCARAKRNRATALESARGQDALKGARKGRRQDRREREGRCTATELERRSARRGGFRKAPAVDTVKTGIAGDGDATPQRDANCGRRLRLRDGSVDARAMRTPMPRRARRRCGKLVMAVARWWRRCRLCGGSVRCDVAMVDCAGEVRAEAGQVVVLCGGVGQRSERAHLRRSMTRRWGW